MSAKRTYKRIWLNSGDGIFGVVGNSGMYAYGSTIWMQLEYGFVWVGGTCIRPNASFVNEIKSFARYLPKSSDTFFCGFLKVSMWSVYVSRVTMLHASARSVRIKYASRIKRSSFNFYPVGVVMNVIPSCWRILFTSGAYVGFSLTLVCDAWMTTSGECSRVFNKSIILRKSFGFGSPFRECKTLPPSTMTS